MSSYHKQVIDILESTAPIAARNLAQAAENGHNLKKDQAYEASLEILDRLGFTKQQNSTLTINEHPSIATEAIALALTKLSSMFDMEQDLKDITTSQPTPPKPKQLKEPKEPVLPNAETKSTNQDKDEVSFQISEEIKQKL